MKSKLLFIIALLGLLISFSLSSCGSRSAAGTYKADLTIAQSGHYTTFVLRENGSAEIIEDGGKTEYTYWEYVGNGIDVKIPAKWGGEYWVIDFDEGNIYYGAKAYRSCHGGYRFTKLQ